MAGYTRQSVADIIANAIIKAAPVNAEFNTIRDAFAQATGHAHDGTSAEGAYVPLISDPNAFNKVVIDSGNNRISFYNDVSSVAVEQVRIEDGVFVPVTDNDVDLGAAGAEFKDLYIDGVGYIDTLAVHENATVVGTLGVTGLSTLATVDINGGNIDGTVIGASSAAAGGFTTVTTSGQAALTSVNIDGGAIDGTTVGITVPAAGAFTTLSSTTGITGDVTGNVTGNLTGNSAGVHTGAVTGDVTGNITAATGSSSFNNVTINGSLDMNSVSSATVTGLSTPVLASDAATKGYVDGEVAALVDAAPGTLDTLNELAAALGDDPNYAATTAASIATKLPLAGGTMTGAIAMGTSKITGMGDPTAAQDAATKAYSDTQDALKVTKAGDTMSGALAMGSNQITGLAAPTLGGDATNKTYVDAILGSATAASASAAAAAVSEANAATSETNAATSESNAATSEANAAASYDSFDDRYLGAKATAPTVDNDGDALIVGALYFNNTTNIMNVYGSGGWQSAGSAVNGTSDRNTYTATSGQTVFAATYDTGYVDVYLNGVKLVAGTDFTATNGTSITLATGAAVNDVVDIVAYGTFVLADHYTEAQSDARYVQVAGDTMTGDLSFGDNDKAIFGAGSDLQIYHDGSNSYIKNNTGMMRIHGTQVQIKDEDNNETLAVFNPQGSVDLYYDNSKKLATTSTGIDVTGRTTTDNATVGSGTASTYVDLTINGASTANYGPMIELQSAGTPFGKISNYGRVQGGTSTDMFVTTSTTNNLLLGTNNTERMRIDSSGNVGIGTSSPSNLLHLYKASGGNYSIVENTSGKAAFGVGASGEVTISAESASNPIRFLTSSGGSEAMRIDSSGNLLVGMASPSNLTTGFAARANSLSSFCRDTATADAAVLALNKKTGDGDIVIIQKDGSTVGSIGNTGAQFVIKSTGANFYLDIPSGGDLRPLTDNAVDLGASARRWDDVYATNGTIQTSDRNEKQDIEALSDAEQRVAVACKGLLRKFRWIDSVAEKGDDARIHFGIIAQDLQDAFAAEGLDAGRYAMFTSSTWWETQTEVPAVEAVEAVEATYDEDGNELTAAVEAVEAKEAYTRTDTYETLEEAPEGATERTRLGVRYPELLAFIIGAM